MQIGDLSMVKVFQNFLLGRIVRKFEQPSLLVFF